ncbi:class I SAM-dependent RNA methyltransferase [Arthrobacter sp. AOP36-C1-22]|uniref:class I SAM-dependent RNA methyltransferase n=1 Tax=Arthrobacter sp. AOP36-C1-22 TaxID=3457683 RepID=UPI004034142A
MSQQEEPATGDLIEVEIGAPAHGGHFVARYQGRVVFVRHALPGERVRARLTDAGQEARFWRADAVEMLEASAHRVPHFWPEADAIARHAAGELPVGGAEFGHAELGYQRELKSAVVREQLERLAGLDADDVGFTGVEAAPGERGDGLGWRTRAAFSVDASGRLAMNAHHSDRLVPIRDLPLAVAAINDLSLAELPLRGLDRIEVAAGSAGGAPLVLLVERADATPGAATRLAKALPEGSNAALITQHGGAAADGAGTLHRLRGRTWVAEQAAGETYRVTGEGFWQIHRSAPDALNDAVQAILDPQPGQACADLYAGAGLFTVPLARAVGAQGIVLSIEGAPGTSKDARRNIQGLDQVLIRQGRVEKILRAEVARLPRGLDGVVLDPPRTGLGRAGVAAVSAARPGRIAYVSCDPASFSRDLRDFAAKGYATESVRALDLYPHTHHVECVAALVPSANG